MCPLGSPYSIVIGDTVTASWAIDSSYRLSSAAIDSGASTIAVVNL